MLVTSAEAVSALAENLEWSLKLYTVKQDWKSKQGRNDSRLG